MFEKILYFGAGLDLSPLSLFKSIRTFVFVDSLPRNEYGYDYYYKPFYRKKFVNKLIDKVESQGLTLISKEVFTNNYEEINVKDLDSSLLYFCNKQELETSLYYYISTAIPNDLHDNDKLIKHIRDCDAVFVSGYEPVQILDYLTKPFHFIGISGTWYPENIKKYTNEHPDACYHVINNRLFYHLLTNDKDVLSYTFIDRNNKMFVCKTYDEFYKEYLDDFNNKC